MLFIILTTALPLTPAGPISFDFTELRRECRRGDPIACRDLMDEAWLFDEQRTLRLGCRRSEAVCSFNAELGAELVDAHDVEVREAAQELLKSTCMGGHHEACVRADELAVEVPWGQSDVTSGNRLQWAGFGLSVAGSTAWALNYVFGGVDNMVEGIGYMLVAIISVGMQVTGLFLGSIGTWRKHNGRLRALNRDATSRSFDPYALTGAGLGVAGMATVAVVASTRRHPFLPGTFDPTLAFAPLVGHVLSYLFYWIGDAVDAKELSPDTVRFNTSVSSSEATGTDVRWGLVVKF